jgi:energy-coupling factor transport system permease protein
MLILDRDLHPATWWIWAAAMAVAITRMDNILYALLVVLVAATFVRRFRGSQPWANAFRVALVLAGIVFAIRLLIGILFSVPGAGTTLFSLPRIQLPGWVAGIRLGGPVTTERLGSVVSEGLVIVALIAVIGAATALTNPRRLLRILPAAVHEVGVALVVAATFTPQLVMSVRRVQDARRLRGHDVTGLSGARGLARPVLEDAIDRALALAAAMESRGYGSRGEAPPAPWSGVALMLALVSLGVGGYGMLAYGTSDVVAVAFFVAGLLLAALSLHLAGRHSARTHYRPESWGPIEAVLTTPAVVTAGVLSVVDWSSLQVSYSRSLMPALEWQPALILVLPLLSLLMIRVLP